MTIREALSIQMGNVEDGWSRSDESSDVEVSGIADLRNKEEKTAEQKYREKYGHDMPR